MSIQQKIVLILILNFLVFTSLFPGSVSNTKITEISIDENKFVIITETNGNGTCTNKNEWVVRYTSKAIFVRTVLSTALTAYSLGSEVKVRGNETCSSNGELILRLIIR